MKTIRVSPSALLSSLAFFVLAAGAFSVQGALYSETFDNTGTGNKTAGQVGWSAFVGGSATDLTNVAGVGGTDYVAIANAAGNPSAPNGFLFANNGATANQKFALVDTQLGSVVSMKNGDSITWAMGNNTTTATAQILIQIGGDGTVGSGAWYVSTTTKSSAVYNTGNFNTAPTTTLTFSTAKTEWSEFSLVSGSGMAIGNALTSDLSSTTTITGIGFYLVDIAGASNSMRLDTLQVIPEPGSMALVLAGGVVSMMFARRRRCGC